jgi:hypothetical protein
MKYETEASHYPCTIRKVLDIRQDGAIGLPSFRLVAVTSHSAKFVLRRVLTRFEVSTGVCTKCVVSFDIEGKVRLSDFVVVQNEARGHQR